MVSVATGPILPGDAKDDGFVLPAVPVRIVSGAVARVTVRVVGCMRVVRCVCSHSTRLQK